MHCIGNALAVCVALDFAECIAGALHCIFRNAVHAMQVAAEKRKGEQPRVPIPKKQFSPVEDKKRDKRACVHVCFMCDSNRISQLSDFCVGTHSPPPAIQYLDERGDSQFEARSTEQQWSNLGDHTRPFSDELLRRFQALLEMHFSVIRDHLALHFRHIFTVYVKNYLCGLLYSTHSRCKLTCASRLYELSFAFRDAIKGASIELSRTFSANAEGLRNSLLEKKQHLEQTRNALSRILELAQH